MDGKLSTLDLTKEGALQWSVPTEPGELLSSSIHRLELTNNGKYVRMIPSLNGGIYKFDGDSLEAIPVTAEDLLKSSFKFSDDMVISGGKETRSYGINTRTGRVIYECSMGGCKNLNITEVLEDGTENPSNNVLDDVLVVKRQTQIVRAIEPRSGEERWNFSIGHHELEILHSENCQSKNSINEELDNFLLDIDIRVIVPEGIVCGYSKKTPSTVLWKQKFDAPIVSVFRMDEKNRLYSVDLFKNVQWLWNENNFFTPSIDPKLSPSVYLGMYQQQLYIQESDFIRSSLDHHKNLEHNLINDDSVFPAIPFKPYPASSTSLVKLIEGDSNQDEENEADNDNVNSQELIKIDSQSVLYASQYVNGKGFYFFTKGEYNHSTQCGKKTRSTTTIPDEFDNVTFNHGLMPRSPSLWDYWKEISVIALTTAFVINIMLSNTKRSVPGIPYVTVTYGKEAIEYQEEEHPEKEIVKSDSQVKIRSASESNSFEEVSNFISRFLTDFDLVRVLGKGGFGVVFEVKNKLDDCNYAIKRILLPSKKESRERVMREVKTLANCEHKNIVRYFHAWVEQPPKGWQELKDKDLLTRDILSTSITIDSPSPTEESKAFIVQNAKKVPSNSPWMMNYPMRDQLESLDFNQPSTIDDTSSFIQFKADSCDLDESKVEETDCSDDDSFKIEFKDSTRNSEDSEVIDDKSHVISIKELDNLSFTRSKVNGLKQGHRRQLSLDLSSISDLKSKKPNVVINGAPQKMYLYIQMQLCMKNSLKDWLRANDLQTRNGKTYEIWNQIIEAVHYVHLKGLIHRDLKPSNIFFSLDGQIKIGDFGLVTDMAEIPVDPLTSSSSNSNSSTNIGDFDFTTISQKKHTQRVGTSLYMSPEQSKGLPYNYKVDIFSLGLILFELLNFFSTETERYKVLENIRKHIFPTEFIDGFPEEVSS